MYVRICSPSYSVISSLISFFIPCVIMVGIYVNVYSFARYHMRSIKEHTKPLIRLRKLTTSMTAGVAEATAAAGSSRNASSQTNNGSSSTSSPPTTTAAATATQPLVVSNGISSERPSPPLEKGVFARVRRKRKKKVSDGNNPGVMETPLYHEHKAAITIGIIMGVFLLCWTPFFVVNVISGLCKGCISPTLFKVRTFLRVLSKNFLTYIINNSGPDLARLLELCVQPHHLLHLQHGVQGGVRQDLDQEDALLSRRADRRL